MNKNLPESSMFKPVQLWLQSQGYKVFGERFGHDVVAIFDSHIIVVELKVSLTEGLLYQCYRAATFADKVYCGISTQARKTSIEKCRQAGLGVLKIQNNSVTVLFEPLMESKYRQEKKHEAMILNLQDAIPDENEIGGVPVLKGIGPQIKARQKVIEYLRLYPNANYQDIYANVPNHYCNHKSMRCAVGGISELKRKE